MSRWRRLWANPHRFRALNLLITRPLRRRLAQRQLQTLSTADLAGLLGLSTSCRAYFQGRTTPVFFFDQTKIATIVAAVPPEEQEAAVAAARRQVLEHTFSFRGSPPIVFARGLDWQYGASTDPDWHRDLHRLDWLVNGLLAAHYSGEAAFARAVGHRLCHWWQHHPLGSTPWADPFEVAQRAHTLSWLVFLGLPLSTFADSAWETALRAVLASGLWLAWFLEYQTPNNHLLIEMSRLGELGLLFPEFPPAKGWLHLRHDSLPAEINRQVLADGFHAELSVFYHRLVLETLLEGMLLAGRNGVALPEEVSCRVSRMLASLGLLRRPDGTYYLWGDGFQTDILLRHDLPALGASLLGQAYGGGPIRARSLWLLNGFWPRAGAPSLPDTHYWPDAGYAVWRRPRPEGDHQLSVDCGPFGLAGAPGHGHADCLSVCLDCGGQQVLVDPGSYAFQDRHWRRFFRSTAAHNTITVDGQDQTPLSGLFEVGRPAGATVQSDILTPGLRFLAASHDGYGRLLQPARHQRLLLDLPDTGWLIIDLLFGSGCHAVTAHWHFHPDISLVSERASPSCLQGRAHGRDVMHLQWAASQDIQAAISLGQEDPPQGWFSETAGLKVPAPVLSLAGTASLPFCLATFIAPAGQGFPPQLFLSGGGQDFSVHLRGQGVDTLVLLGAPGGDRLGADSWETDGSLAVYSQTAGGHDLVLAGGRHIWREGRELLALPRATSGMLVTARPDGYFLAGDIPLPLQMFAPEVLPVMIADRPAPVSYNRQRRVLEVLR